MVPVLESLPQPASAVEASTAQEFRKLIDTEYEAMGAVLKSIGLAKQ